MRSASSAPRNAKNQKNNAKSISCHLNHEITEKELTDPKFSEKLRDRICCVKFLLTNIKVNYCLLCSKNLPREKCRVYTNLCVDCIKKYESNLESHLRACNICKKKFLNELSGCVFCEREFFKTNLFKTPLCRDHFFCDQCLSRKIDMSEAGCKCIAYFSNLGKKITKNEMNCNLCGLSSNVNDLKCGNHCYCNRCLKFVMEFSGNKFPNFSSCKECVSVLKKLKEMKKREENKYVEEEKISNKSEQKDSESKLQSLRSSTSIRVEANHQISGNPILQKNDNTTKEPSLVQYEKFKQNNNLLNDPQTAYKTFDSRKGERTSQKNILIGASTLILNNKPNCADIPSQSVNEKMTAIEKLINEPVSNLDSPVSINSRKRKIYENKSLLPCDSFRNLYLGPKCTMCANNDAFTAFKCNHNYCKLCLIYHIGILIYQALADQSNINPEFKIICKKQGCSQRLFVPSFMVISMIRAYKENPEEINRQAQEWLVYLKNYFLNSKYEDLKLWILYFDGIKSSVIRNSFIKKN